jgi:ribulose-5-phosphate 4-epimerase/fuculose-1-phosphate aldolase
MRPHAAWRITEPRHAVPATKYLHGDDLTMSDTPPRSGGPVDAGVIADLVTANRILADQGVLDGYGHVSVRHPGAAGRYFLSRSRSPAIIAADDIMEYDLDSNPVDRRDRLMYIERYIHGEIYKARPDVSAVVHSHSPAVIPFGVTTVKLRAICHMSAFLKGDVPNFEIRDCDGMTDLLVRNSKHGAGLARTLGAANVALMRGHGNVCVGSDIMTAVYRAVYTEVNARLQAQAIALGGPVNYLAPEECDLITGRRDTNYQRPWAMWKSRVATT